MKKTCTFCKKKINFWDKVCPYCYEKQTFYMVMFLILLGFLLFGFILGILLFGSH